MPEVQKIIDGAINRAIDVADSLPDQQAALRAPRTSAVGQPALRETTGQVKTESAVALAPSFPQAGGVNHAAAVAAAATAEPATAPKPLISALATALDEIALRELEAEEARQADIDHAWAHYVALIARADNPRENDVETLLDLMRTLSISRDQVEADRKIILKYAEQAEKFAKAEQLKAEYFSLIAEYNAVLKRHEQEERDTYLRKENADVAYRGASSAPGVIAQLCKQRPQLFASNFSASPFPKLKTIEVPKTD